MAELALDVVEQILVQLDVEDLIRYKSVCKPWHSLISSPRFVKAHLNRSYNNDRNNRELGHRRIALYSIVYSDLIESLDGNLSRNETHIVGSCNGLVCVSPQDFELVVTNPSTREQKKLPTPPYTPRMPMHIIRYTVCWGFGYDSSTDDYKVIAGFRETYSINQSLFYALSLKSNTWKAIGQVNYRCIDVADGVLCGGALHWFMNDNFKKVIISLDLSTQEFKEIPQPVDGAYVNDVDHEDCVLGVIEECLCIFWDCHAHLSSKCKTWVMKNNKWKLYNGDHHCETKYDAIHYLCSSQKTHFLGNCERMPSVGAYACASVFVKSLVSPHPHFYTNYEGQKIKGQEGNASVRSGVLLRATKEKER